MNSNKHEIVRSYDQFLKEIIQGHPKENELHQEWQTFSSIIEKNNDYKLATLYLTNLHSNKGLSPKWTETYSSTKSPENNQIKTYTTMQNNDLHGYKYKILSFLYENLKSDKPILMFTAKNLIDPLQQNMLHQNDRHKQNFEIKSNRESFRVFYPVSDFQINNEFIFKKIIDEKKLALQFQVDFHMDGDPMRQLIDELLFCIFWSYLKGLDDSNFELILNELYSMLKESIISFDDISQTKIITDHIYQTFVGLSTNRQKTIDSFFVEIYSSLELSKGYLLCFKKLLAILINNMSSEGYSKIFKTSIPLAYRDVEAQFILSSLITKSSLSTEYTQLSNQDSSINLILRLICNLCKIRVCIWEIATEKIFSYSYSAENSLNVEHQIVINRDKLQVYLAKKKDYESVEQIKKKESRDLYGYEDFMNVSNHSNKSEQSNSFDSKNERNANKEGSPFSPYNFESFNPQLISKQDSSKNKDTSPNNRSNSIDYEKIVSNKTSNPPSNNGFDFDSYKNRVLSEPYTHNYVNISNKAANHHEKEGSFPLSEKGKNIINTMIQLFEGNTTNLLTRSNKIPNKSSF